MAIVGKKTDLISRVLRRAKEEIPFPQVAPRDVETVLYFVKEHLFDPDLNVDRLRVVCQLRNHNISTRFKDAMGVGIREYIEQERIQAAMRLLEHNELEVWRVATSLGFSSPESFCRSFRRQEGTSPSAYRANAVEPLGQNPLRPTAVGQTGRGPELVLGPQSGRRRSGVTPSLRDVTGDDPAQKTSVPTLQPSLAHMIAKMQVKRA